MKKIIQNKNAAYLLAGLAFVLIVGFFIWAVVAKHENGSWLVTAYERGSRKLGLVNAMRTSLLVATEAEKSSVMADTDEASQSFAEQSIQASATVEEARREFSSLLDEKKTHRELESFQQFSSCWEKLQEIDREILPLAVQNTNLKALRLSFGPAAAAVRRMESALNQLMDASISSPDALKITRLSSIALTNAFNIYALQAPHIAETSDPEMDNVESAMNRYDEQANQALNSLNELVAEAGRPFLDKARASYDDFRKTHHEIIELSRQNSNIRSFAISLGQKRNVTAQCLDSLAALEKGVQESMTFRATR
ncbi:MAG: MCP four helix bundle domain-containing protein [Syntrophobacteraceae bacterium]